MLHEYTGTVVETSWNVMAHAQKRDFVFRAKRTSQFKSAGEGGGQFCRLLAAQVCASAVVMLDTPCSEVVWRVLDIHSIHQFPLHFPSSASPCAITFQLDCSNAGYTMFRGSVKSTGYPFNSPVSPSLPLPASPCAITFQLESTPVYFYMNILTVRYQNWHHSDVTKLGSANSTRHCFYLALKQKITNVAIHDVRTSDDNFKWLKIILWWFLMRISHQVPIQISSFVVL
jgi:hypothetical protein